MLPARLTAVNTHILGIYPPFDELLEHAMCLLRVAEVHIIDGGLVGSKSGGGQIRSTVLNIHVAK